MSLANDSFADVSAVAAQPSNNDANNAAQSPRDRDAVPTDAQRQLMIQRAATAVPGTHIDGGAPENANNSMARLNENSHRDQDQHEPVLEQRESSASHHSSADLVSNMPDPIVPNRSRHSRVSEDEVI